MKSTVVALLLIFTALVNRGFATEEGQIVSIKEAVNRWLCYEVYWGEASHRLGKTYPLFIRLEGEKFFALANDLEPILRDPTAGFYIGRLRNGKAAVISGERYNVKLNPPLPSYLKAQRLFESQSIIKTTFTMPPDCTPKYDSVTPQKELMINTVVKTMQKNLNMFVSMGIAKYPKEVTLIIADFNIDYPYTFVLVEQTKEVYIVTLHDTQNYDSDEFELEGQYPFGQVYDKWNGLLEKISKHSIFRKIILTP